MTPHRAALPVTTEFTSASRHGFPTAGPLRGMRLANQLIPPRAEPDVMACPPAGPEVVAGAAAQPAATCLLGTRPESVKAGRDFTRATLRDWDLAALSDLAELVVSELVTNALRHGIPSARKPVGDTRVRLRLLAQAPFVLCMVTDPGIDIPVLREPQPTAESGRGLKVVESCCVRWGWHLLDEGGKVVWALMRPPA